MKVLFADALSDSAVDALRELGCEITINADLKAEELPGAIGDSEVLVVRSTKVTAATIQSAPSLALIIRAGAGVNTIDLDEASANGITVANCPGKNTDAVAELAIGHLVAADRRIHAASNDLANGAWKKKEYGKSHGLKGRVLGVVGLGCIGRSVVAKAKGLEMAVVGWSPSLTPARADAMGIGYCASPLEVAAAADAVTLHVASKPATQHLVNDKFLAAMKDGAILVNTSRGEVVDTAALKRAIATKGLRVGLDVFENEPTGGVADFTDTELATMATCTPHIGASTAQASEATAEEVVDIVRNYLQCGKPTNAVNLLDHSAAVTNLTVRHFNKVGVLAAVLTELRGADINVQEMENTIFAGGKAACCILRLDDTPTEALVGAISGQTNVIQVSMS